MSAFWNPTRLSQGSASASPSSDSQPDPRSYSAYSSAAFLSALRQGESGLDRQLTEIQRRELLELGREQDPEIFWQGLFVFGIHLEDSDKPEAAAKVYAAALQAAGTDLPAPDAATRKKIETRFNAIQGKGAVGERAELLLKRFAKDACDAKTIVPMLAGSAVFSLARAAALGRLAGAAEAAWYTRGFGARLAAGTLAFTAEVPTFALASRTLRQLGHSNPADSQPSWAQEFAGTALTLGTLKAFAFAGNQAFVKMHGISELGVTTRFQGWQKFSQAAIPQASMFVGMLASHSLEEKVGLRAKVDGATTVLDTLASMVSLGVGSHLGNRILGTNFAGFQRELETRTNLFGSASGARPTDGPKRFSPQGFELAVANAATMPADSLITRPASGPEDLQGIPKPMMMELKLGQSLELRQSFELRHSISLHDIYSDWGLVYDAAEKRSYQKHGLDFEYAVVRRKDFPYMLSIGSAGLQFDGMSFVMEDFFVDSKITPEIRAKLVELIAVHEYGERIFGDHHQASLLEFAVAEKEGFLKDYLKILQQKYFLKFRDVALKRMGEEFKEALQEAGAKEVPSNLADETAPDSEQPSVLKARALRDSFRWPQELHDEYSHALDEDQELAREKIRDWASYIVVNEQIRGYFDRAGEAAAEAGRKAMIAGPAEEIGTHVQAAFYHRLRPLYLEIADEVFSRKHFEKDVLRSVLKATTAELLDKLETDAEIRLPDPDTRTLAKKYFEELPLLARDLDQHLQVLGLEDQWLEHFGFENAGESTSLEEQNAFEAVRAILWKMVDSAAFKEAGGLNGFRAPLRYTPILAEIRQGLQRVLPNIVEQDFIHYLGALEKGIVLNLARAAEQHPKLFAKAGDPLLQAFVDAMAIHFSARAGGVEPWKRMKLDVPELRKKYGANLQNFPRPDPKNSELDWLEQQHLLEFYETGSPGTQAQIASELFSWWGKSSARELFELARSRNASLKLAAHLILKTWSKESPFNEEVEALPFLPYIISKYGLSQEQVTELFREILLRKLPFQKGAEDPAFQEDFARLTTVGFQTFKINPRGEISRAGFPEKPSNVSVFFSFRDFEQLLGKVRRQGLASVQEEHKKSFADQDLSLSTILDELYFLAKSFRNPAIREKYRDPWEHPDFWQKLPEMNPVILESLVPDLLRIESAKDLLSWFSAPGAKSRVFNERGLPTWLKEIDTQRRAAWAASRQVSLTDSTFVPLPLLRKLAAQANTNLELIAHNYRLLLARSNPQLRQYYAQEKLIEGPALEVFANSGDPRWEKVALLEMAQTSNLKALERCADLAEADLEVKAQLMSLDLARLSNNLQALPFLNKMARWNHPQALATLGAMAARGQLEALKILAEHPELGNKNSEVRKQVLTKLDLSTYRRRKDAEPVLKTLAEQGVVPALALLPLRKSSELASTNIKALQNADPAVVESTAKELEGEFSRSDSGELLKLALHVESRLNNPKWQERKGGLRLMAILLPRLATEERLARSEALIPLLSDSSPTIRQETRRALETIFPQLRPLEIAELRLKALGRFDVENNYANKTALLDLIPSLSPQECLALAILLETRLGAETERVSQSRFDILSALAARLSAPDRLDRAMAVKPLLSNENESLRRLSIQFLTQMLPGLDPQDRFWQVAAFKTRLKMEQDEIVFGAVARSLTEALPHLPPDDRLALVIVLETRLSEENRELFDSAAKALSSMVTYLEPKDRRERVEFLGKLISGSYSYQRKAMFEAWTRAVAQLRNEEIAPVYALAIEKMDGLNEFFSAQRALQIFREKLAGLSSEACLKIAEDVEAGLKKGRFQWSPFGFELLDALIPRLEEQDRLSRTITLENGLAFPDQQEQRAAARFLARAIPYLKPQDRFAKTSAITSQLLGLDDFAGKDIHEALVAALPHLSRLEAALVDVQRMDAFPPFRKAAKDRLLALLPILTSPEKLSVATALEKLILNKKFLPLDTPIFEVLAILSPSLDPEERLPLALALEYVLLLDQGITMIPGIRLALAKMIPLLEPNDRLQRAIALASSPKHFQREHREALSYALSHLNPVEAVQVEIVMLRGSHEDRESAIKNLVKIFTNTNLDPADREKILSLLDAPLSTDSPNASFQEFLVLKNLAPFLNAEELRAQITIAEATFSFGSRPFLLAVRALAAMIPQLPPEERLAHVESLEKMIHRERDSEKGSVVTAIAQLLPSLKQSDRLDRVLKIEAWIESEMKQDPDYKSTFYDSLMLFSENLPKILSHLNPQDRFPRAQAYAKILTHNKKYLEWKIPLWQETLAALEPTEAATLILEALVSEHEMLCEAAIQEVLKRTPELKRNAIPVLEAQLVHRRLENRKNAVTALIKLIPALPKEERFPRAEALLLRLKDKTPTVRVEAKAGLLQILPEFTAEEQAQIREKMQAGII